MNGSLKEQYGRAVDNLGKAYRSKKDNRTQIISYLDEFPINQQLKVLSPETSDDKALKLLKSVFKDNQRYLQLFLALRECFKLYYLLPEEDQDLTRANIIVDALTELHLWGILVEESLLTDKDKITAGVSPLSTNSSSRDSLINSLQ